MVHVYRESYTNSRGTIDCFTIGNIRPSRDPTERSKALHDKNLRKTVQKSFSLTIPTRMAATMLHSGRDVTHSSSWNLTTFGDYGRFLSQRYIIPHFTRGITEVHLIFDNPGQLKATSSKKKRDEASPIAPEHVCEAIQTDSQLKWREKLMYYTAINAKDI